MRTFNTLRRAGPWIMFGLNVLAQLVLFAAFLALVFLLRPADGAARSWLDVIFPFLFLVVSIAWLPVTRKAYRDAQADAVPAAQPIAQFYAAPVITPAEQAADYLRENLMILVRHEVISQAQHLAADIAGSLRAKRWKADPDSFATFIQHLYCADPDLFQNLYCRTEQVDIAPQDYATIIAKWARMLGLSAQLQAIQVTDAKLSFDLDGVPHEFAGTFPAKHLDWDIVPPLVNVLEQAAHGKRLCNLAGDKQLSVTALTKEQLAALNADLGDGLYFDYLV